MATVMKIADLRTDGLQSRLSLSEADVKEYAEKMDEGIVFDPLVVFDDGKERYLADGFHRLEAMKRRGLTEVEVELREGSRTEALRYSLGANAKHGRKLTPADNRHKLEIAWANQQELFGGRPSHELLAQTCAVSTKTVQRFMKRQAALDGDQSGEAVPLVSMDGKKRTVQPATPTPTLDTVQSSETVTVEEPPAKQEVVDRRCDPSTVFQDFNESEEIHKARNDYVASLYGTFAVKDEDSYLKKDKRGNAVPLGLSRRLNLSSFEAFETVYSCIRKAYGLMEEFDELYREGDSNVFGRFFQHEYDPMGLIEDLYNACEECTFKNVCKHCGGKGCAKCGHMGFETCGDIRAERKRREEEAKKAAERAKKEAEEAKEVAAAREMLDLLKPDPIPESFRQKMKTARPVEPADVGLMEAEVQDDLPF